MSKEIGQRIKAAREKLHWSQAKLANAIGVNPLTVLRWEQGRTTPHYENRQELIRLLKLRLEDFSIEEKQPPSISPIQPDEQKRAEVSSSQTAQSVSSRPEHPHSFLQLILPSESEFKSYQGRRVIRYLGDGVITRHPTVTVNGNPLKYFGPGKRDPVEGIVFEWGYLGEGPRILAESILADFFAEDYPEHGDARSRDYNALLYGSLFKKDFIGTLPLHYKDDQDDEWEITSDQIRGWFNVLEEKGITRETLLIGAYGKEYYMKD